jgi:hypothetical protein
MKAPQAKVAAKVHASTKTHGLCAGKNSSAQVVLAGGVRFVGNPVPGPSDRQQRDKIDSNK